MLKGKSKEPTEVTLIFKGLAPAKHSSVRVIKAIEEIAGLELIDSRKLVTNAPSIIKEKAPLAEAEKYKAMLVETGGVVEIK